MGHRGCYVWRQFLSQNQKGKVPQAVCKWEDPHLHYKMLRLGHEPMTSIQIMSALLVFHLFFCSSRPYSDYSFSWYTRTTTTTTTAPPLYLLGEELRRTGYSSYYHCTHVSRISRYYQCRMTPLDKSLFLLSRMGAHPFNIKASYIHTYML